MSHDHHDHRSLGITSLNKAFVIGIVLNAGFVVAEFFDGVGGRAVLPVGTDVLIGVPDAVVKDLLNVLHKDLIGVANDTFHPNIH